MIVQTTDRKKYILNNRQKQNKNFCLAYSDQKELFKQYSIYRNKTNFLFGTYSSGLKELFK